MSFQSLSFLGFFIVAAPLCLLAEKKKWGLLALLLASLWAYGTSGLWVLLVGLCVTYGASGAMAKGNGKLALVASVCYHIVVLLAFQHLSFFTGGALALSWRPVGISFFTFSQIWYLKAVYEGSFTPVSWDKLGLYGLFFPTVTSGPILSPNTFFPHLEEAGFLRPSGADMGAGLCRFALGLVQKVLLADQLALIVATGYSDPEALTSTAAWLVILAFTLQLYLDFSGYCHMALGVGQMLGIPLPENFNAPYRATSIGDFWKRWHITLTNFLRHCVYLPLGGNRKGPWRTYLNILIVFAISGFWHGAGWTFILWGLVHGLGQIAERMAGGRLTLPNWLSWSCTFLFLNLSWVLFRAPSLVEAGAMFNSAFGFGHGTVTPLNLANTLYPTELTALLWVFPTYEASLPLWVMGGLFLVATALSLVPSTPSLAPKRPWTLVVLGILFGWSILSLGGETTFIYANF